MIMKMTLNKRISCMASAGLLLFSAGMFALTACSDDETVVVPDNWVTTTATEGISIDYNGGTVTADFQLASGLDTNYVYVVNEEEWCLGYIKDRKLQFDIESSSKPEPRTAISYLIYDDTHKVEITVTQGAGPVTPVTDIVPSDDMPTSISVGETLDLAAYLSVLPENASYQTLNYSVDDASIATVAEDGKLTGVAGGTVNVTATAKDENGYSETFAIAVESKVLLSRDGWTVTTNVDYGYCADGTTGKPEDILDGDLGTFLSLAKPGKTLNGCTTPDGHVLAFTVDCQEEVTFNYFYLGWRSSNSASYLRVPEVQLYGSHDGSTFEPIGNPIETNRSQNINYEVPTSTYRYVKVEYTEIDYSSGSSAQVAEFSLGMDHARE